MGRYVYKAPEGSTLDIGDEQPYQANKPFDLDDERAKAVRSEVPQVVPAEKAEAPQESQAEVVEGSQDASVADNRTRAR